MPNGRNNFGLLPQGLVNSAAGYGDSLSFGGTNALRDAMNINQVIDKNSNAYNRAKLAGTIHLGLLGSGLALSSKANSSKAAFSISASSLISNVSNRQYQGAGLDITLIALTSTASSLPVGGPLAAALINFQLTVTGGLLNHE